MLQFLRELHFIEACPRAGASPTGSSCSSFGNCTSLRLPTRFAPRLNDLLQFLRELHFIEASTYPSGTEVPPVAVPSGTALH